MRPLLFAISFLALCAVGCSKPVDSVDAAAASRMLMEECSLSFREVLGGEKLAARPFVRPEHVARLELTPKHFPEDDPTMMVTLTAQGERRMLSHTKSSTGRSIAAFCGDAEISRAIILEPFGNHFEVAIRQPGGT